MMVMMMIMMMVVVVVMRRIRLMFHEKETRRELQMGEENDGMYPRREVRLVEPRGGEKEDEASRHDRYE